MIAGIASGAIGPGEVVALAVRAAEVAHPVGLLGVLDPLGDGRDPERLAHRDDRARRAPPTSSRGPGVWTNSLAIFSVSTGNWRRWLSEK